MGDAGREEGRAGALSSQPQRSGRERGRLETCLAGPSGGSWLTDCAKKKPSARLGFVGRSGSSQSPLEEAGETASCTTSRPTSNASGPILRAAQDAPMSEAAERTERARELVAAGSVVEGVSPWGPLAVAVPVRGAFLRQWPRRVRARAQW